MEITITGRHLEITPAIRQHSEDKASKLPKFYDQIVKIEIVLEGQEGKDKRAEIVINAGHQNHFVASHEGADLYGCIDHAIKKIQQQLTAHKEMHRNRKHIVPE